MYELLNELLNLNIRDISIVKEINNIDNKKILNIINDNIFLSNEFNNIIEEFIIF
jgi:hypothetical protein